MAESDAGSAGMTEKLHRLFPDGKWPEFPYRENSHRLAVDEDAATNLFALLPEWGGNWHDFEPWLRESSNYPTKELPDLSVKTVCTAVGKAAQRERDRRLSIGLMPIAGYGTSASSFVSVPVSPPHSLTLTAGDAAVAVVAGGKKRISEKVIKSAAVLTFRRKLILVAILAMDALDSAEAVQAELIHRALGYAGIRPDEIGKSFASHSEALRSADLIASQRTKPYGYWLTSHGKAVAEYLCESDSDMATARAKIETKWNWGR